MGLPAQSRFTAKVLTASILLLGTFILYTLAFYGAMDPGGRPFQLLSCLSPVAASGLALAFIITLLRRLRREEDQRRIWSLFAVATAFNLVAEAIWMVFQGALGREISYPLLADIFWLASYPLFVAGLLLLLRGFHRLGLSFRRYTVGPVLALIIIALLLVTIFLVLPVVGDESASLTDKVINPAYAYLDLLILVPSLILALAFSGGWQGKAWSLISASFFLMALADMLYSYLDRNGLYGFANHLDLLWVASYLTLGLAAAWQELNLAKASYL